MLWLFGSKCYWLNLAVFEICVDFESYVHTWHVSKSTNEQTDILNKDVHLFKQIGTCTCITSTHTSLHTCMRTHACTHVHILTLNRQTQTHTHTHRHRHTHARRHAGMRVLACTQIHTHTHAHAQMHAVMYTEIIYVNVYVHEYLLNWTVDD